MAIPTPIKEHFGELLTGYDDVRDFTYDLEQNKVPGYVYVDRHLEADYEDRHAGPIVLNVETGQHWWINWEVTSYDSFPEYATISPINKVVKEVWV